MEKLQDLKELQKRFNSLKAKANNLASLTASIANLLARSARESFDDEKDPITKQKWESLSEVTLKQKIKKHKNLDNNKILTDTSTLRNSIYQYSSPKKAGISTNLSYGAIHNFGGKAGRGKKVNIPARTFMPIKEKKLSTELFNKIIKKIDENCKL